MDYKKKYLKYKKKYIDLKKIQLGGKNNDNHKKMDLIEIIYNSNSGIKKEIIKKNELNKTFYYLNKQNLLKKQKEIFYVFDLHNVLDLLDNDFKIKRSYNNKIICCSYVGKYSDLRNVARDEVILRIQNKQIDWGVLVFKRGKKHRNDNPFVFHKKGSKAWFCNLIKADYFFDDSKDHIESVKSMLGPDISVKQIFNKDMLIDEIKKIN